MWATVTFSRSARAMFDFRAAAPDPAPPPRRGSRVPCVELLSVTVLGTQASAGAGLGGPIRPWVTHIYCLRSPPSSSVARISWAGRGSYLGTVRDVILLTLLASMLSIMQIEEAGKPDRRDYSRPASLRPHH